MTSSSVTPQPSLYDYDLDGRRDHDHHREPNNSSVLSGQDFSSVDSSFLSPFLSQVDSDTLSPSVNHLETPAGSASTLSHYQSSDFGDIYEDPLFFSNIEESTPSFLDEPPSWVFPALPTADTGLQQNTGYDATYPLTPEQTASIHTISPRFDERANTTQLAPQRLLDSISPQELQKPFKPSPIVIPIASQLTPSQSSSCLSSEDGLAPAPVDMHCQSPRVTVSVWDQDNNAPVQVIERSFEESPSTARPSIHSAGDLISSGSHDQNRRPTSRDSMGQWQRDPYTGHSGLDPIMRPKEEVASINEIVSRHQMEERNQEVGQWLMRGDDDGSVPREKTAEEIRAIEEDNRNSIDNIPAGDQTENRYVPGQTYYTFNNAQATEEDYDLVYANRNWADGPVLHPIRTDVPGRNQPQSSQAAIERFERMCRDTDSILSRAATWGTRRRSLPSIIDFDMEGITGGSLLKKLSISRGNGDKNSKPGSLLKDLRGLVRRPSTNQVRKRSRSGQGEALFQQEEPPQPKRESITHLSPTSRTSSWSKKPTPSINNMLVSMGHNIASIGTAHSRSGSISGPIVAPARASLSAINVKNTLRRPRSKSELPKSTVVTQSPPVESHPTLVDLWKKSGGPPVASISKTSIDVDDDDEDDDDFYEDSDLKANPNIIDSIAPNFAGFQQHVQTLNPGLGNAHGYLVDRIAHQQIIRYKQLLNAKVKHLGLGANCPCGSLCMALNGSANLLDSKGDSRDLDPLSTQFDEDDMTPTEGAINQDSFPQDIPMPPTQHLPAEFECQLCYQRKKSQKPSDWTKHVHEDVQPFTCTWDKCRDPKIFKRKADWVRHENEGHRHLEWWTCDVDDCRHTCYRRDNFLQHLVREHKFLEPKVKTKAAMKKAGGIDSTWQKVEQCHIETSKQPQEEPCRFCGKVFPTWKKLTVHLAKHMEQIALPVLRLVAAKAKELAADTIISPVQDPPPRHVLPLPGDQNAPSTPYTNGTHAQMRSSLQTTPNPQNHGGYMYPGIPAGQFPQQFYPPQYGNIDQNLQQQGPLGVAGNPLNHGFEQSRQFPDLPVASASYVPAPFPFVAMPQDEMGQFQPPLNALGLHNGPGASVGGQHMSYDGMMDPTSSGNGSPFSGHEALSTYSHSPHVNAGNQDGSMWDDRQQAGFM